MGRCVHAPEDDPLASARRRGRRAAFAAYWVAVVGFILVSAAQITQQVWAPATAGQPASCKDGLRALAQAIDRAREAAEATDVDEDGALERYRAALLPTWAARDEVASACRGDKKLHAALDAIDRLRYAEEHAVRREAAELAPLRRTVRELMARDLLP